MVSTVLFLVVVGMLGLSIALTLFKHYAFRKGLITVRVSKLEWCVFGASILCFAFNIYQYCS